MFSAMSSIVIVSFEMPIVTTGAGRRDLPHQANERVEVAELATTARIYRTAALLYLEEEGR